VRANWILRQVAGQLQEMTVGLDGLRMESALEEVARKPVATVERLRVHPVQPLETIRERGFDEFDDQVIVVRHQAVRVEAPPSPLARSVQQRDQAGSIGVVTEDFLPSVSACGHVEDVARALGPESSRHVPRVRRSALGKASTALSWHTAQGRLSHVTGSDPGTWLVWTRSRQSLHSSDSDELLGLPERDGRA
jgi:hypothetical protein